MSPLIGPSPREPDGFASIESRVEANINELSYLEVSLSILGPQASWFITNILQNSQRNNSLEPNSYWKS
jgi:hypothetical protein